eukprot:jgi/Chrpa1/12396/Chrysochromulina_OHIO_Genome00000006-RA
MAWVEAALPLAYAGCKPPCGAPPNRVETPSTQKGTVRSPRGVPGGSGKAVEAEAPRSLPPTVAATAAFPIRTLDGAATPSTSIATSALSPPSSPSSPSSSSSLGPA